MKTYYVPVAPKACPRPRVTKRGHAFMPKAYTDWKKSVVAWLFEQWDGETFTEGVTVNIMAVFKRRSSTPKKRPNRELKISKPDVDNCAKAILDSMVECKILHDDNLVCILNIEKWYAALGEEPHMYIEVDNA
tara:strand:+ start:3783 stop:4181 length:399 start_codon:yes stop_codon:yes gene_type:complete